MSTFYIKNITHSIKIVILILFSVFVSSLNAQKYNFKNFSINDGISQSEIYSICEDKRGNLWFGSLGGGVMKYDGYNFTAYKEEDGLLNNFVLSIFEDTSGKLWIGTEEGLCIYNGISFKSVTKQNCPINKAVRAIIQDSENNIWIGTEENGIYKFDGKRYTHLSSESMFPEISVYCLYEDKMNNIWIGTESGVYKYNSNKFTHYTRKDGLVSDIIRGICEDNQGNIWFTSYDNGVSCFNGKEFKNFSIKDGLSDNIVYSAINDKKGNLWFGTDSGISKFNGTSFKIYSENNGISSKIVLCIYMDSWQNLWFGTSGGGIIKFDNERFIHFPENEKMGRRVYAGVQIANGNMVFGSSKGGLSIFSGNDFVLLKGKDFFTESEVRTLYFASDSTLWIGTLNDEIHKFDKAGFHHYSSDSLTRINKITGFTEDTYGNIWVSSLENGISVLYKDSSRFVPLTKITNSIGVYTIKSDNKANIWAGTDDAGLIKITVPDNRNAEPKIVIYTEKDGIADNTIRSIVTDTLNNVFLGTAGGGISVYNGKEFRTISKKNGLSSNNIYSLIFDNDYKLFAGTESGIDRITFNENLKISELRHYGRSEGFAGIEIYRNASCKEKSGNLWFGTVNGIIRYNPTEDVLTDFKTRTHITGIKLFYKNIEDTEYADSVAAWYPIPAELTLPYNQNNLTFEFVGIYHRNPEAVRYKIKLEGMDDDWSHVLNQINSTDSVIPPGEYPVKVLSCNEYGVWNIEPDVFKFKILAPVWEKWWFKAAFIGFFILLILIFVYSRFRRIKKKNETERERLETEKSIIELEQQAARLQMNPHFIFNSLNSIQGFIASENAFEAKRYLAKFARLMRLILENSREEFVPLKNEVDILKNYLELEKLSTNNKFEFSINADKLINAEITEIPPMMIQPFVENAIIHGIKKKSGKGLIEINFRKNNNLMVCEIIDNGIGRQQSGLQKTQTIHKSTGISVTKKRLEQLKIQTGEGAGVEIIDLVDDEKPVGTKVVISFPFESY